jgi:YVTN family beta-propeller protein
VANTGPNIVSVIATASNTVVATIPVGNSSSGPFGVAITPDGNFAYVTNNNSNTVSVIGTGSKRVIATIPVDNTPAGVAITH